MDMSCVILLLCIVYVKGFVPYDVKWFEQDVDHFNFYSASYGKSTYKQKYLVQDKWWNSEGGPIFLYTGNEAPITAFWNNSGFLFDIAPQFQALVVFAEHRYYGDSLPFGSKSFDHPYVDLLTVEQTLADFAELTVHIKEERNATNSPVIAFGGSYGGMLSAWMRFKFPNVIDGAIAASAPIYLIGRVVDRDFFFSDVTKDFHDTAHGCDAKVREAFDEMESLSKTKEGLGTISTSFNLCKVLNSTEEYQRQLVGWIRNSFTSLAMFDYPYPTTFFSKLPANPIKVACDKLVNSADPIKGLAQAAGLFYGSPDCYDIWTEYVECADPTGCGTGPESLAWDYQACTEMLMPAGTNNVTDMFPVLSFSLDDRAEYCKKRWGVEPRLDWMKVNMWGTDIQYSSDIVFSNGNLDPWHRGGVLKNVSESLVAVLIDGGAHHLDLRSSNPLDPVSVKEARSIEVANIRRWIKKAKRKYSLTPKY